MGQGKLTESLLKFAIGEVYATDTKWGTMHYINERFKLKPSLPHVPYIPSWSHPAGDWWHRCNQPGHVFWWGGCSQYPELSPPLQNSACLLQRQQNERHIVCVVVITPSFSPKSSLKTPHSSPVRVSYVVSFVGSNLIYILPQSVIYAISCYIGSRYNATR